MVAGRDRDGVLRWARLWGRVRAHQCVLMHVRGVADKQCMDVLWGVIPEMVYSNGSVKEEGFDKVCALMQRLGGEDGTLLDAMGAVNPALFLERLRGVFGRNSTVIGFSVDHEPDDELAATIATLKEML